MIESSKRIFCLVYARIAEAARTEKKKPLNFSGFSCETSNQIARVTFPERKQRVQA